MRIFKELSFVGDRLTFDEFKKIAPSLAKGDWEYLDTESNYIVFNYMGKKVEQAKVSIHYYLDTLGQEHIKVVNIIPLQKGQLSIEEYNAVLDLFCAEIIASNLSKLNGIEKIILESDVFNPLRYITMEALKKLERFCYNANKATGSSHPNDVERWLDFICQTVDDGQTFDSETIYKFLMDKDFWGIFAWDEKHASELAMEYAICVRLLEFYKAKEKQEEYEKDI